jgi:hypothetical protein
LATTTFCWLPPESNWTLRRNEGVRMLSSSRRLSGGPQLCFEIQNAGTRRQVSQRRVLMDPELKGKPLSLSVLREVADTGVYRGAGDS